MSHISRLEFINKFVNELPKTDVHMFKEDLQYVLNMLFEAISIIEEYEFNEGRGLGKQFLERINK